MKITRIRIYKKALPYSSGTYVWGAEVRNGKLFATDAPGLGVQPDFESLGMPVAIYGAPE
jgi:hypothetical protein